MARLVDEVVPADAADRALGIDDALDRAMPEGPAHLVVLDHWAGGPGLVAGSAEYSRVDAHRRERLVVAQDLRHGAAGGREEKLVHVDERDPAGIVLVRRDAVVEGGITLLHAREMVRNH